MRIFRKLLAFCLSLICLSAASCAWADCTTRTPVGSTVNGTALWGDIPVSSVQATTDCNIDQFAWNNFLYLAGDDGNGHPRFMGLTPWYDAMPLAGKPFSPGKYTPLQSAQMANPQNKGQAGDGFNLLDVNGQTVAYEIRVNDAIVKFVANSGTYTTQAIAQETAAFNANPSTGGIWLPPITPTNNEAALEIKTSWRNYGTGNACPADIMHCEKDSAGTWWGLIGLHLVQKTPTHGEMIWASFEHITNSPDCATGGSNPVAQNPGSLNANKNIPALAGQTGWGLFNYSSYGGDGKTCTYPKGVGVNAKCLTNPNPSNDGKTWVAVNVCRTDQLPPPTAANCSNAANSPQATSCLNNNVQNTLSGKWKNYVLIGSEHVFWGSTGGAAPLVGCWNFEDGDASLNCVPSGGEGVTVDRRGTLNLANSTMETWMQKNINLVTSATTWTQQDCFSCHQPTTASYQGDMSHLFGRAQQIGDVKAGPIWNNGDAQMKCPSVCQKAGGKWNGQWNTTVPGKMSVCGCVVGN